MALTSYFYLIPSGIVNSTVSDSSKLTYAVILGLSNQYGYCFATNQALAVIRNVSESTLKRHIKELIDAQLVEAEYSYRNDRRLTPKVLPVQREKVAKNGKEVAFTTFSDDVSDTLDTIWRKMR